MTREGQSGFVMSKTKNRTRTETGDNQRKGSLFEMGKARAYLMFAEKTG